MKDKKGKYLYMDVCKTNKLVQSQTHAVYVNNLADEDNVYPLIFVAKTTVGNKFGQVGFLDIKKANRP